MSEIIVEIGNTHDGSLGIAMSLARMAAEKGAKIVKFQMHISHEESRNDEPFRVSMSPQYRSRKEYWERVNFSDENWHDLSNYVVKDLNIEFLCTPFSKTAAIRLLESTQIKRWKVGSGDATNWQLIDFLVETQLPVILSTGLVSMDEIKLISHRFEKKSAIDRLTLLHCVSSYPAPLQDISLSLMQQLRDFAPNVGFSDHSGDVNVSIMALAMGADIVEVHFTPHKSFYGPDVASSLDPDELGQLFDFEKSLSVVSREVLSKQDLFQKSESMRRLFRKGLYWAESKSAGNVVTSADVLFLKPVEGLDAVHYDSILSRKLAKDVAAGSPVFIEDFLQ